MTGVAREEEARRRAGSVYFILVDGNDRVREDREASDYLKDAPVDEVERATIVGRPAGDSSSL